MRFRFGEARLVPRPERRRAQSTQRITAVVAGFSLVGCATLGFDMPGDHCALAPAGCNGAMPLLQSRPDYPSYDASPWAADGVQGIAHDAQHWYLTSTSRIWKVPLDQPLARAEAEGVEPFDGRYAHLGDPDFHDGVLFVPLEADRSGGPPAIGALRPDLTPIGIQTLDGARHAPWCAVHPHARRLYTSDFSTDRVQVFRIELTSDRFALVYERDLALRYSDDGARNGIRGRVPNIQGGAVSPSGKLYLATNHRKTGIVVFDAHSGAWLGRLPISFKPKWSLFTHEEVEGLDLFDLDSGEVPAMTGQIHLLLRSELPRRRFWLKHWGVTADDHRERL